MIDAYNKDLAPTLHYNPSSQSISEEVKENDSENTPLPTFFKEAEQLLMLRN